MRIEEPFMPQLETVRIGHSPDSDDAFMFYALAKGLIPTEPFEIVHVIEDIETLNRRALAAELEVTAISVHAYAYVANDYIFMPCGASIGDRYGPLVVSKKPMESIAGKRVAIPGEMTTAYLTMRLYQPNFEAVTCRFDEILATVQRGDVDAGLIIHEGQLTYEREGFHKIVDLGEWWDDETGLPLYLSARTSSAATLVPRTFGKSPHCLKRASSIRWSIANAGLNTQCFTRATWRHPSPTGSSACM